MAGPVGGPIAGNTGQQIGTTLGGLAQQYLPFSAGPQMAPQGIFGNVLGGLASQFIPFSAGQPVGYPYGTVH